MKARGLRRFFMLCLFAAFATAAYGCPSAVESGDGGIDAGTDGGVKNCTWLSDCPSGDCVNNVCVKADRCRCDDSEAQRCYAVTIDGQPVTRPMHICYLKRWVSICQTDLDCPSAGFCHNGLCEQYTFKIDVPEPNKGGAKGVLKAGYGEVLVDFPVGVSMAGYAGRSGPTTPYNDALGGSVGYFDRPTVKAIAVDNGAERIVFLRHASSWSTDYINTMVASKLATMLGENYINKIISTCHHSHSYPARYWTTGYKSGLGVAGADDFMSEIFDRLTTSYAKAIELAVKNLEEAKVAYAYDTDFDPKNAVIEARSADTFGVGNKDRQFLVMRFDSVKTGKTLAVMMRYGSHGTHMGSMLMSGDAPGAAEQVSEEYFARDLGYRVPVMFVNGNGGNTLPTGQGRDLDPAGKQRLRINENDLPVIQAIGAALYPMLKARYDECAGKFMTSTPDMKVVSSFIPLGRKAMGYGDSEFYADDGYGKMAPYWNGAMFCAAEYRTQGWQDGFLNCLIQVDMFNDGTPFPELNKLRTTSARIGDLLFVALPGEVTQPYGKMVIDSVKSATGLSDVFTIGYSQDHEFYLLTEDDWWKGSYEGSMDVWGWKFGGYVAKFALDNTTPLKDITKAGDNINGMKHSWYDYMPKKTVTPVASPVAPGFFVQPAASAGKMEVVTFKWHGGHPGVGAPRVFLEEQVAGEWKTVKVGESDYDDTHFHMIVRYVGNYYEDGDIKHDWMGYWEEMPAFRAGIYRFRAEGNVWNDTAQKAEPYKVVSSPFELMNVALDIPASRVVRNEAKTAITFNVYYPPPPQGFDDYMKVSKAWRLNSRYTPQTMGAILDQEKQVDVIVKCGAEQLFSGKADVKLSTDLEARTGLESVPVTYNVHYTSVTVPVDAGKGCEYGITVSDQWGNSGSAKKAF
ncbi:MAG: neutral/alkaline non-lysosomal ceramidase N-terminal domain-containing protein [Myxococcota bacterium]